MDFNYLGLDAKVRHSSTALETVTCSQLLVILDHKSGAYTAYWQTYLSFFVVFFLGRMMQC